MGIKVTKSQKILSILSHLLKNVKNVSFNLFLFSSYQLTNSDFFFIFMKMELFANLYHEPKELMETYFVHFFEDVTKLKISFEILSPLLANGGTKSCPFTIIFFTSKALRSCTVARKCTAPLL